MPAHLDTNAILRYLLNDIPEQAEKVSKVIEEGRGYLSNEVLAEAVFVLGKIYDRTHKEIAEAFKTFLGKLICADSELFEVALDIFAAHRKLDIVDALLAARHAVYGATVLTFDKDLIKVMKQREG